MAFPMNFFPRSVPLYLFEPLFNFCLILLYFFIHFVALTDSSEGQQFHEVSEYLLSVQQEIPKQLQIQASLETPNPHMVLLLRARTARVASVRGSWIGGFGGLVKEVERDKQNQAFF